MNRRLERVGIRGAFALGVAASLLLASVQAHAAVAKHKPKFRPYKAIAFPGFGVQKDGTLVAAPEAPRFFDSPELLRTLHPKYVRIMVSWLNLPHGSVPGYDALKASFDASPAVAELRAQIDSVRAGGAEVFLGLMSEVPDGVAREATTEAALPWHTLPKEVGADSEWGNLVRYLVEELGSKLWAIEIMNEPNKVRIPNRKLVYRRVVDMIETAHAIRGDRRLTILAPATEDGNHAWVRYTTFTKNVLKELDARCAKDGRCPRFLWSHHNYGDLDVASWENGHVAAHRTQDVVDLLACSSSRRKIGSRGAGAKLYLTEGGVKTQDILPPQQAPAKQAAILSEMWTELRNRGGEVSARKRKCPGGHGRRALRLTNPVRLWTQYKLHDGCGDAEFQTGLLAAFHYAKNGADECQFSTAGAAQSTSCLTGFSPHGLCHADADPRHAACAAACTASETSGSGERRPAFQVFERF